VKILYGFMKNITLNVIEFMGRIIGTGEMRHNSDYVNILIVMYLCDKLF
jgi:hypothetical protein